MPLIIGTPYTVYELSIVSKIKWTTLYIPYNVCASDTSPQPRLVITPGKLQISTPGEIIFQVYVLYNVIQSKVIFVWSEGYHIFP